ncbi:MAG: hypothetical protein AB1746_08510, partial [Candidatus Zixiibacteriota bacterium]
AAGFIIAGLLMVMIRSFLTGKTAAQKTSVAVDVRPATNCIKQPEVAKPKTAAPEFISLSNISKPPSQKSTAAESKNDLKIRNRQEIIRMAKKVLSGQGDSASTGSLPITDGELAMIKQRLNLQGAGRNK